MYVYGNGKWHWVERTVEQGQMKFHIASCGQHYPGECNTSDDPAVLDSRFFCVRCLAIHREKAPAS